MSILEVRNLCKNFGEMAVIRNLSFTVNQGEVSSIIGPNGAGKTTLFNLCTGHFRCTSGQIIYKGKRIERLSRDKRVKMGIGRAFQIVNVFPELTVFENIRIPVISHFGMSMNFYRNSKTLGRLNEKVLIILENIGILDKKDHIAAELDHGDMKLLDIALALALEPEILFLDEPTAGMTPDERKRIIDFIKKVCKAKNITLILIEHDMDMVFAISEKIRVLNYGELLAEGTPEEISQNPMVLKAYLGDGTDYYAFCDKN